MKVSPLRSALCSCAVVLAPLGSSGDGDATASRGPICWGSPRLRQQRPPPGTTARVQETQWTFLNVTSDLLMSDDQHPDAADAAAVSVAGVLPSRTDKNGVCSAPSRAESQPSDWQPLGQQPEAPSLAVDSRCYTSWITRIRHYLHCPPLLT